MNETSLVGEVINDYRVLRELGRGGMGVVYEAENVHLERRVALKFITPTLAKDDSFIRRFKREAKALAKIVHPSIVTVYAFRPTDDSAYIAMEFIDGETLGERLNRQGAFTWDEALPVIKKLLRAFSYAHERGIIHRDIKPANIMLTEDGGVKVMDFGLAKSIAESTGETTATGGAVGTLLYMSPEQARGDKQIDQRSDLLSLGLTIYEMLSGRLPFEKSSGQFVIMKSIIEEDFPNLQRFNPDIPRHLAKVLMKALEKDPAKRYQSAAEMLEAIESFEEKAAAGNGQQTKNWGRLAAMITLGLLLIGGIGYAVSSNGFWSNSTPSSSEDATTTTALALTEQEETTPPDGSTESLSSSTEQDAPLETPADEDPALTAVETTGEATSQPPVESQEPASARGSLRITSTPSGATIYLDGRATGQTPRLIRDLAAGRHEIRIEQAGHARYTGTATVEAGQTQLVEATLVALQGTLGIQARPWGDIYVDDQLIRRGADFRQAIELPAGQHRLRIVNSEQGTWERTVTLQAGQARDVVVDFAQQFNLTVTTKTNDGQFVTAEIFVDGASMNAWTPREVTVPLGRRRLEARTQGYQGTEVIMVDAQTSDRLEIVLEPTQ